MGREIDFGLFGGLVFDHGFFKLNREVMLIASSSENKQDRNKVKNLFNLMGRNVHAVSKAAKERSLINYRIAGGDNYLVDVDFAIHQITDALQIASTFSEIKQAAKRTGNKLSKESEDFFFENMVPGWLSAKTQNGETVSQFFDKCIDRVNRESRGVPNKLELVKSPSLTKEEYKILANSWASQINKEKERGKYSGIETSRALCEFLYGVSDYLTKSKLPSFRISENTKMVTRFMNDFWKTAIQVISEPEDPRHEDTVRLFQSIRDMKLISSFLAMSSFLREKTGENVYTIGLVRKLLETSVELEEPWYREFGQLMLAALYNDRRLWAIEVEDYLEYFIPERSSILTTNSKRDVISQIAFLAQKLSLKGRLLEEDNLPRIPEILKLTGVVENSVNFVDMHIDMDRHILKAYFIKTKTGEEGKVTYESAGVVVDLNQDTGEIYLDVFDSEKVQDPLKVAILNSILVVLQQKEFSMDQIATSKKESQPEVTRSNFVVPSIFSEKKGLSQTPGSGRKRKHQQSPIGKEETEVNGGLVKEVLEKRGFRKPKLHLNESYLSRIPEELTLEEIRRKINEYNASEVLKGKIAKTGRGPNEGGRILMVRKGRRYRILAELLKDGTALVFDVVDRSRLDDTLDSLKR